MQEIINEIAVMSLLVLGVVCTVLALWCKYNDGLIGKMGLAAVALSSGVGVIHYVERHGPDYDAICAVVFVGMAIFMVRHLWRRLPRLWGAAPMRRAMDRRENPVMHERKVPQ